MSDRTRSAQKATNKPWPAAWLQKQRQHLIELRERALDIMTESVEVAAPPPEADASPFGMHLGDAGTDAYDRDFAFNLISREQDAIYEIEDALRRMEMGLYGICEMSGERIARERLEAVPFARYTVTCQEKVEKEGRRSGRHQVSFRQLFQEPALEGERESEESEPG